ncbi:MAG: MFS transporter [Candidatus Berkiella sp.]
MDSENKFTLQGALIWFICAIFYTYELLLRTVLGTFQQPIMQDLSLTPFSFALMSTTCYLIVYCVMQVPAAIITNRYGLKKTLMFATALCAVAGVGFAYTYELNVAIFFRMLMGLGSSFGFVCLLMSVYEWMPKKHYGTLIGVSQFIGLIGPMVAAGPLNSIVLANNTDWRVVLFSLGLIGVMLTLLVISFVKDSQNTPKFKIIEKKTSLSASILQLIKQNQIWLIAIYSALVYFTVEYLSENEGKAFIELNGFSSSFSSYMITLGWIGCAIGCPVLGALSDIFKRRKLVMVFAALCCLVSFTTIVYFPISKAVLAAAFFVLGFGAGGQSIGFAIMAEQCNKNYLAMGLGFNNAMIALLMSLNAPIVGKLLTYHGLHTSLNINDYRFAFSFIILLLVISVFISVLFIKETYCRPTKGYTVINWLNFLNTNKNIVKST